MKKILGIAVLSVVLIGITFTGNVLLQNAGLPSQHSIDSSEKVAGLPSQHGILRSLEIQGLPSQHGVNVAGLPSQHSIIKTLSFNVRA